MRVVVLGGGNSPERDVSLRSSAAVSEALQTAGFEVLRIDPRDGWDQLDSIGADDIVFPILHGAEGEDGMVQKMLEDKKLKYLGSNSSASRLCFDKGLTLSALKKAGIPVADGESDVTLETYQTHRLKKLPHVLKVQRGGSSIGTYLIKDPHNIDGKKIDEVFALDNRAILEELVDGIEITVPILDQEVLPVIEIVPPENGEFDYENKYNGKSQEICPATSIDADQQREAQKIALEVHNLLGCRHLSRVDMIVRKDGSIIVLEDNTLPGMTNQSLFPLAAKVAGYPMPELMKKFVSLVQRGYDS